MKSYPKTDKEIASFWGVAIRTLFRWKGDGAPIHDHDEMLRWLSTRKNLPRAVLAKINLPDEQNVSSNGNAPGGSGAAAALKRLEKAELQAFERLQEAIARGNPLEVRERRETWLRISESLRKYDLQVEAHRRDAGELVPVSEVQKFIASFIVFAITATTVAAEGTVNELTGKDELGIYAVIRKLYSQTIYAAVFGYIENGGRNDPDPRLVAYAEKCVKEQFAHYPVLPESDIERQVLGLIRWANVQP
jgi:hypothetical protein